MSTLSMFNVTVPVYIRYMKNLDALLDKAVASADARKIDHKTLLQARLAPDMYPFTKQIQIVTDMTKGCISRLAGAEIPKYEDNEASFSELKARLQKTIAFLQTFKPEQIDGTEDKVITLSFGKVSAEFKGMDYVLVFTNFNVGFHAATAYDILRHNGVELSKKDFIG